MMEQAEAVALTRRGLLTGTVAIAGAALGAPRRGRADDEALGLIEQLTGRTAVESDRVRLTMPRRFPNGYIVPLTLEVDSPMSLTDHVGQVRVLAPRNPIIEVGTFHFTPRGIARVSTRIRLAQPQHVLAVAEMSDGKLLMAKAWVEVETDGCS